MKPFDLEAAKRGEPIQNKRGAERRFVAHAPDAEPSQRVICLNETGHVRCYSEQGGYCVDCESDTHDLCMAPRKRTVWVNVYPPEARNFGGSYETEAIANNYASPKRIGCRAWPLEIED